MPPDTSAEFTQSLLARAHSPDTVSRIYTEKLQYRNLHLRPTSPPPPSNARKARRLAREEYKARSKKRPAPLSSRQRRALGLHTIPRQGQKYATYVPLHRLWLGYVREVLGGEVYGGPGAAAKLSAAEFHGAEIEVVRSNCPSRVGIKGIVLKDARFTFEVLTAQNKVKLVPKEGTMFRVEVPVADPEEATGAAGTATDAPPATAAVSSNTFAFEIMGDQFLVRGADRAGRKFKSHFLKDV
ncbi:hypothetical protein VDGD_10183 [Verticillium dahliae]|nr:hypothetical protein VdG1_08566 [Verticillium dahliae VDG1]RBQ82788.1 hypothetical protein VDGD_10183 [Verticillium dahliae]